MEVDAGSWITFVKGLNSSFGLCSSNGEAPVIGFQWSYAAQELMGPEPLGRCTHNSL